VSPDLADVLLGLVEAPNGFPCSSRSPQYLISREAKGCSGRP
jgi:hypothetical protein